MLWNTWSSSSIGEGSISVSFDRSVVGLWTDLKPSNISKSNKDTWITWEEAFSCRAIHLHSSNRISKILDWIETVLFLARFLPSGYLLQFPSTVVGPIRVLIKLRLSWYLTHIVTSNCTFMFLFTVINNLHQIVLLRCLHTLKCCHCGVINCSVFTSRLEIRALTPWLEVLFNRRITQEIIWKLLKVHLSVRVRFFKVINDSRFLLFRLFLSLSLCWKHLPSSFYYLREVKADIFRSIFIAHATFESNGLRFVRCLLESHRLPEFMIHFLF